MAQPHWRQTCIIGGGLAGLTTALQLARAGLSVAVLEAERIGWGASGRNGGFVFPGYATDIDKIAKITGEATANQLYRLSIEGMRFVRDTIRDLEITSAGPKNGIMSVLRYRTGEDLLSYADHMHKTFDYPLEYMARGDVEEVLKSDRYFEALRDPEAFHMHPLNYLRALAVEIVRLGGKIFESSAASKANFDQTEKTVQTRRGTIRSRRVVITTVGIHNGLHPPAETQLPAYRHLCPVVRGSAGSHKIGNRHDGRGVGQPKGRRLLPRRGRWKSPAMGRQDYHKASIANRPLSGVAPRDGLDVSPACWPPR